LLIFAGDGDADTGAVWREIEGVFSWPAAGDLFRSYDGAGGDVALSRLKLAVPESLLIEGEVSDEILMLGLSAPFVEAFSLASCELRGELVRAGEASRLGGDFSRSGVGKTKSGSSGEESFDFIFRMPFDFAIDDVELTFFRIEIEGELGAKIERGASWRVNLEADGVWRHVCAELSPREIHFLGGKDFEFGISFHYERNSAEKLDLNEARFE